jgi:hypothetical protein
MGIEQENYKVLNKQKMKLVKEVDEFKEQLIKLYINLEEIFSKQSNEMQRIHELFKQNFPEIIYDSMRL